METKARQLNNRRSKTKSYSSACLRTVQIESKTRRGNCEALSLEIPPPPASSGALPPLRPPSLASPPPFLHSVCFKLVQPGGGGRGRARAAGPRGAEVRRRRSLAGCAAFIISRKSQFHFHFPKSRQREQQAAARESGSRTGARGVISPTLRGRRGRSSGGSSWKQGGEGRHLPLPPRGPPEAKERAARARLLSSG